MHLHKVMQNIIFLCSILGGIYQLVEHTVQVSQCHVCFSFSHNIPLNNCFLSIIKSHLYVINYNTRFKVNESVCRVDFDEAWIRTFGDDSSFEQGPFPDITSVPNSPVKSFIRNVGRVSFAPALFYLCHLFFIAPFLTHLIIQSFFIEPFAVFPVSYLDNDIIVFDFELLGTRICARKE